MRADASARRSAAIGTLSTAAAVCVASWVGLLIGAGNVGLQRSVAVSPLTLFERPLAVVLAVGLAFVVALGAAMLRRGTRPAPLTLLTAVLGGDAVGALVLAPLAVGELTPLDAPEVFAALTVIGLQPVAAAAGAVLGRVIRRS